MTWPKGYRPPTPQDTSSKIDENEKVCRNCNKSNPLNSRFCNQCGFKISDVCNKCGNMNNQLDSKFCNQCSSPINNKSESKSVNEHISEPTKSLLEKKDNFLWYVSPDYNLRILYPNTWRKIENQELANYPHRVLKKTGDVTEIVMFEPNELPLESTDITISREIKSIEISLENLIIINEHFVKVHNPNSVFLESKKNNLRRNCCSSEHI